MNITLNIRLIPIVRKEIIHILREPRTLITMLLMPVVELILLGYSATSDIRHLRTAVYDADQTAQSRQLIEAYRASDYFEMGPYVRSENEMTNLLDRGDVRAGLIIPSGYGDNILKGVSAQVAFLIDGSDPSVATPAFGGAQAIGQALNTTILQQRLGAAATNIVGIQIRPRVWYNPEQRSANYMIPGLIGMILQFLTIQFTALAIVRERELGTIEQLVVTPIRAWELMLGKVIPYAVIGLINLIEIIVIGVVLFNVPVRGSLPLMFGMAILFLMTTLGLGLFISSAAKTQREASQLSTFIAFPTFFLSGFFFPLEAMPAPLQFVSYLVPLRYMLVIMRAIVLKGVGLPAFTPQAIALAIFGMAILAFASTRFHKRLE